MATSGTITASVSYVESKGEVSISRNGSAVTTTVKIYFRRTSYYVGGTSGKTTINIIMDGKTPYSKEVDIRLTGTAAEQTAWHEVLTYTHSDTVDVSRPCQHTVSYNTSSSVTSNLTHTSNSITVTVPSLTIPAVTKVKIVQDGTSGFTIHVQASGFDSAGAILILPVWVYYDQRDIVWAYRTKTTHTIDGVTYHYQYYVKLSDHDNYTGNYNIHFYYSTDNGVHNHACSQDGITEYGFTPSILTVNYYSNYATEAYSGALNAVGADKNVLIGQWVAAEGDSFPDNLHDYDYVGATMYLGREGYTGTGHWGTTPEGGTLISQAYVFYSYSDMCSALGVSSSGNVSVNLYAQWDRNSNIRIKVDGNWKEGKAWVKVDGVWKEASDVYMKVNGAWKKNI